MQPYANILCTNAMSGTPTSSSYSWLLYAGAAADGRPEE